MVLCVMERGTIAVDTSQAIDSVILSLYVTDSDHRVGVLGASVYLKITSTHFL